MRRFRSLVVTTLLAGLVAASGASAWQTSLSGSGTLVRAAVEAVAADGQGNLFLASSTEPAPGSFSNAVTKVAAATGAVLWRQVIAAAGAADCSVASDFVTDLSPFVSRWAATATSSPPTRIPAR
jgi:outer membrane protein assembly factor BamB